MQAEQKELTRIIKELHGCEAAFVESVPVKETFNKLTAWQGVVEVFDLTGHPKATRCYAWSFKDKGINRTVTVLNIAPVDSPETAVKVAVANEARKKTANP